MTHTAEDTRRGELWRAENSLKFARDMLQVIPVATGLVAAGGTFIWAVGARESQLLSGVVGVPIFCFVLGMSIALLLFLLAKRKIRRFSLG